MKTEIETVNIWNRARIFQKMAVFVLLFFSFLMALVTVLAHVRKSGVTGLDMGKIQQMRAAATLQPVEKP